MISRYTSDIMKDLWSRENKFGIWLQIEILVCEAWAKIGVITEEDVKLISDKADFSLERIDYYENLTKHEVIAFIKAVSENLGDESRYLHLGLTSSDIMDTSLSYLMVEAINIIIGETQKIKKILYELMNKYKYQPMIGRTHGIHAEPITFGLKMALFYEEIKRNLTRLESAKETISVGKLSGAVGTYSNLDPSIEQYVCNKLGLKPDTISSQIIQRDRHAEFLSALAITSTTLDKLATQIRLLQQTELSEVFEPFSKDQKGSSAMPHKRNPILNENVSGLSRVIRANVQVALENMVLWQERDISHSSAERIIIADSTTILDFQLRRTQKILKGLEISKENMAENLSKSTGQISSSILLNNLIIAGMHRDTAYDIIQTLSKKAIEKKKNLKELALKDKTINEILSNDEISDCFDMTKNLKHIDYIYDKLLEEDDVNC
jgi:adenylosuccinate lyase